MSLVGWLALGAVVDEAFMPATGYQRVQFTAYGSPPIGAVPRILGHPLAGPVNGLITHGAIFDAPEDGHALVTWSWLPPFTLVPADFPPTEYVINFTLPATLALNSSLTGHSSNVVFSKGQTIGQFNGHPW